jgi:ferredoxin
VSRNLRIVVDDNLCKSSRNCFYTAPSTFQLSGLIGEPTTVAEPPWDDERTIIEAAQNCPQGAVAVFDADTGEDITDSGLGSGSVGWRTPGAGA